MSPQPSAIAHYKLGAKLGEGGMGAVYRATDTKLNRDVAIKVLPASFAADPDRMARFAREAQVLASLNHPNIAAIYGIESGAIVMELVEGEDLKGPVPLDTALNYARQIASALEAAHEKGIVHRDLKPANIKVTPDGVVKLLDFGLAKAAEKSQVEAGVTSTMTMAGSILGTPAYMSPEQARGKPVDKRADIWAFGVVLFELLTGKTLFGGGETVSDSLAAVITKEPDLSTVPERVRPLLRACLEKDPRQRLRDIGDWQRLLAETDHSPTVVARTAPWRVAAAILALAAAAFAFIAWKAMRPVDHPLSRFLVDLGPDSVRGGPFTAVLSPDGRRLVFLERGADGLPQLATRLLDEPAATVLAGATNAEQPFFSPDGQWIGFFSGGDLKKISVHGGATVRLAQATAPPRGATWLPDGTIIANLDNRNLFRLPDSGGGKPQPLADPIQHGERTWRWPQAFAKGQLLIFTAGASAPGTGTGYDDADIDVLSLRTGKLKTVARGGYFGRYLPSGHIVYVHQGTLFAVPFDSGRMETRGSALPVLDDVASTPNSGAGQFAFSDTGTLVYLNGKATDSAWNLSWLDAAGKLEPVWSTRTAVLSPRISPDGKLVAGSLGDQFVVYDLQRGSPTTLSLAGNGRSCVWAPDGKHLAYSAAAENGELAIRWIRTDGSSEPITLFQRKTPALRVTSFSPDGRNLAYYLTNDAGNAETWILPLDLHDSEHPQPGTPELFADRAGDPAFSPDGRWVAFTGRGSVLPQIFVRPFPRAAGGGRWQVSNEGEGGAFPLWLPKGGALLYRSPLGRILSVAYQAAGNAFAPAKPVPWSPVGTANLGMFSPYDLSPDGKRFLLYPAAFREREEAGSVRVTVLLNFFDELKRRLP